MRERITVETNNKMIIIKILHSVKRKSFYFCAYCTSDAYTNTLTVHTQCNWKIIFQAFSLHCGYFNKCIKFTLSQFSYIFSSSYCVIIKSDCRVDMHPFAIDCMYVSFVVIKNEYFRRKCCTIVHASAIVDCIQICIRIEQKWVKFETVWTLDGMMMMMMPTVNVDIFLCNGT